MFVRLPGVSFSFLFLFIFFNFPHPKGKREYIVWFALVVRNQKGAGRGSIDKLA